MPVLRSHRRSYQIGQLERLNQRLPMQGTLARIGRQVAEYDGAGLIRLGDWMWSIELSCGSLPDHSQSRGPLRSTLAGIGL